MDLLLTVVRFGQDAESGEDVLVSAPEESTVADLARSLDEYLGPANRASGPAADAAENGASAAGASAASAKTVKDGSSTDFSKTNSSKEGVFCLVAGLLKNLVHVPLVHILISHIAILLELINQQFAALVDG